MYIYTHANIYPHLFLLQLLLYSMQLTMIRSYYSWYLNIDADNVKYYFNKYCKFLQFDTDSTQVWCAVNYIVTFRGVTIDGVWISEWIY
jgi:hypothetical protein